MKLREVMTRGVEVVHPESTLREAARKMREHDVGVLPVCEGDHVIGVVTDRDLTVRATAEGRDPDRTRVSEAVTRKVDWLYEDDDVEAAARLMRTRQIRRLLVLDRQKRIAGIVSLGDLATESRGDQLASDVLEGVSEDRGSSWRGRSAGRTTGAGGFSQSNQGSMTMRDRFGRDIGYGYGRGDYDRDERDERQGFRGGFGMERDQGRMMNRGVDRHYNRDMGRWGEQDRDYGRGMTGRDYERGWSGREDERDYNRSFGQGRGWGREMGQGTSGHDYNRGMWGRDMDRDYGRGTFGRDYDRDYNRGTWGRDMDRDYNRGMMGRDQDRGVFGRDYDRGHDSSMIGTWTTRGYQCRGERSIGEMGRETAGGIGERIGELGERVRRAFGRGPKGYKRSDDRIREDICEMLSDRDDVDSSEVIVRVQSGEVTLEGTVDHRHDKRMIEQIAENVRGVDDVHNQIRVRRATETTTGLTSTTATSTTPDGRVSQTGTRGGMANDVGRRS